MKIVFQLPEDDPKNPGVIADCTGDNAGDSVGPTADGFETYGVTGVALISFLALSLAAKEQQTMCGQLITWLFVMRILMILTSLLSYFVNEKVITTLYGEKKDFDFEAPLTHLVWLTSIISIGVTFVASNLLLGDLPNAEDLWWALSVIISCGTLAGAIIPEFTKVFTSTNSRHVREVVNASRQGGASLNILSGFVAGNMSAFWQGLTILLLMMIAYFVSTNADVMNLMGKYPFAAPIFAFDLVAFGFLGMGPVTIAVDSFGPVTDNAQSVYELSQIEAIPGIRAEIQKDFGFDPDFENAKHNLEKADGAGNTFKATAKPVLIGTAVVGATTMVFGIILLLENMFGGAVMKLSIVQPEIILGLIMGGSVIYWFTGASTQAVVTGAYRAVVFIKENIKLDSHTASIEDSKEVVKICTQYAQKGMTNIFVVIFACRWRPFLILFLYRLSDRDRILRLFQAVFMANAGGAWDNAKKIVEVDLRQKIPASRRHRGGRHGRRSVQGHLIGFLNPVIKFTTLFGLLAVEIAVTMENKDLKFGIGAFFFLMLNLCLPFLLPHANPGGRER